MRYCNSQGINEWSLVSKISFQIAIKCSDTQVYDSSLTSFLVF